MRRDLDEWGIFFAHVFSRRWIRETKGWSDLVLAMVVSAAKEFETIIRSWLNQRGRGWSGYVGA